MNQCDKPHTFLHGFQVPVSHKRCFVGHRDNSQRPSAVSIGFPWREKCYDARLAGMDWCALPEASPANHEYSLGLKPAAMAKRICASKP